MDFLNGDYDYLVYNDDFVIGFQKKQDALEYWD